MSRSLKDCQWQYNGYDSIRLVVKDSEPKTITVGEIFKDYNNFYICEINHNKVGTMELLEHAMEYIENRYLNLEDMHMAVEERNNQIQERNKDVR